VGTGSFDLGCVVADSGVSCSSPSWVVPEDGIVVVSYSGACCFGDAAGELGPSPAPGATRVEVGACGASGPGICIPADMIETPGDIILYFDAQKIGVLEARWGPKNADVSRAQVLALIASWRFGSVSATPSG
jgi:hypothetical protein